MTVRKERRPWRWLVVLVLLVGLGFTALAAYRWWYARSHPVSGQATLVLNDELRHTLSFATGKFGYALSEGRVVNVGSDIDYRERAGRVIDHECQFVRHTHFQINRRRVTPAPGTALERCFENCAAADFLE